MVCACSSLDWHTSPDPAAAVATIQKCARLLFGDGKLSPHPHTHTICHNVSVSVPVFLLLVFVAALPSCCCARPSLIRLMWNAKVLHTSWDIEEEGFSNIRPHTSARHSNLQIGCIAVANLQLDASMLTVRLKAQLWHSQRALSSKWA